MTTMQNGKTPIKVGMDVFHRKIPHPIKLLVLGRDSVTCTWENKYGDDEFKQFLYEDVYTSRNYKIPLSVYKNNN